MGTTGHLHWLPQLAEADEALRALARIGDPGERLTRIQALARHPLDFIQTGKLDRALEKTRADLPAGIGLPQLKLAWLSSSTVDHQVPSTRIAGLRRGLAIQSYVAPFNQYRQALLDPDAPLARFGPQAVLFAIDPGELAPSVPLSASAAEVEAAIEARVAEVRALWHRAREKFSCVVVHQLTPDVSPSPFGSYDRLVPAAPAARVAETNRAIARAAAEDRVLVLDLAAAAARLGHDAWFDPVRWHHGKQLIAPQVTPLYGDLVARILAAARGLAKKCLILDLDNTLWGGVVGDDGLENLVLGQGSAEGEAFLAFQRYALTLKARGIVLAVCSKNNHDTAEGVFLRHPEMILRRDDIAAFVANWYDKATNVRHIAGALNLGLDAMVFFDDNPAERAIIRRELPMVEVPEVPEDPALYARCLAEAGYFEAVAFTAEDRARAEQYRDNARREEGRRAAYAAHGDGDLDGYLASLGMELIVGSFDEVSVPRVAQLIGKTNQWNLTTRRYSEEEVRALGRDPSVLCLQFRLKDTFGDNGIISVVIARQEKSEASEASAYRIDTWLMSCRVLGRGVETAVLNVLAEAARSRGAATLVGEYLPTPKNELVREHYPRLGFEKAAEAHAGLGSSRWALALGSYEARPVHIQIAGALCP
jgi:FkbH-like protein